MLERSRRMRDEDEYDRRSRERRLSSKKAEDCIVRVTWRVTMYDGLVALPRDQAAITAFNEQSRFTRQAAIIVVTKRDLLSMLCPFFPVAGSPSNRT